MAGYDSKSNEKYSMDSLKIKNAVYAEEKVSDEISIEFSSSNLTQAYVYSEIFGKPISKRRRGGTFGFKGHNR